MKKGLDPKSHAIIERRWYCYICSYCGKETEGLSCPPDDPFLTPAPTQRELRRAYGGLGHYIAEPIAHYHSYTIDYSRMDKEIYGKNGLRNFMIGRSHHEMLPSDITSSQFIILREYDSGVKKSKEVSKNLSMDKKTVEAETKILIANGYLSNTYESTSKALNLLFQDE